MCVVIAAFFSALIIGLYLHYHKIVKNEFYGYPQEWFPSVSATIGDRYPERSFFMIFIAITSGTQQSTQLYSDLFMLTGNRSSIRSRRLMVSSYAQAGPEAACICRYHGTRANTYLRRLDIHYIYR